MSTTPRSTPVPSNPYDVSQSYAGLVRTALSLAIAPGLGLGLLLIAAVSFGLPFALPWPQLAQAHGQVQLLAFVPIFVLAVALQLFPRFLAAPLRRPGRVLLGGSLLAIGAVARLLFQPIEPSPVRTIGLTLAALAPFGLMLALVEFWDVRRRSVQPATGLVAAWQWFVGIGGVALAGSVVLHAWITLQLAADDVLAPPGPDEALTHLELSGFATCLALGVSSRLFGRFLLLRTRPAFERRLPQLAVAYGLGVAFVVVGWAVDQPVVRLLGYGLESGVLAAWVWLAGLYDNESRPSGMPHVTYPTRRWVRLAFGFLLFGAAFATYLASREVLAGMPALATELSATRHAVAQGFLLVLMASMAGRMLPIYSADVLRRGWLLELTVDLLLLGALLRVGAEAMGGYRAPAGWVATLGGTLTVAGFSLFAAGLWSSLSRLPHYAPQATGMDRG